MLTPLIELAFSFIERNEKVQIHEDEVKEIINELKNIFKPTELNMQFESLSDRFNGIRYTVANRWDWIFHKNAERIADAVQRSTYLAGEKEALNRKLDFLENRYEQWKEDCGNLTEILRKTREFMSSSHNAIRLSTIHRAKGLENERVFILHYDELPFQRPGHRNWEKTQELNLKYVAITRALNEFYLIEAKKPAAE